VRILAHAGSIIKNIKRSIGEAVVGDDFVRQDGVVDGIALGASTGAVVGGTVGAARGLLHQSADRVTEVPVEKQILDPKLNGYTYRVSEDWDRDCTTIGDYTDCDWELDGWWHRYSPRIDNRVVGRFERPELRHSHDLTMLGSAVTGAAVGAGIGAAAGLATGIIGKTLGGGPLDRKPIPPELREQLIEETGENVVTSTAVGAGIGGALGLAAGLIEQSNAVETVLEWNEPIYNREHLGTIPRNHYEWNWSWDWADPSDFRDHSPKGDRPIVADVPVLSDRGEPRFQEVSEEFHSARFGPLSGMVGGALIGAGLGLATGVAGGVVGRLIAQS